MNFMHRRRRPLALLALIGVAVSTTASPVSAEYIPSLGRFAQRDPNGMALVLQPSLAYHAANPTVTVSMAYQLQYADGMNFYEFVRSNPVNRTDPSGLLPFSLPDLLSSAAIRAEVAAISYAGAHPLAMRFIGGLLAAANLYAFAQYEEAQAIIVAQPNPLGFLTGEAVALRLALRELTATRGSITALNRASASTRELVTRSTAFVRRATQSFKPFTQGNFRENLGILTGGIREGFDAHHVFPVALQPSFQRAGIDIHDPIYGAWWQWRTHRGGGTAYNKSWETFFTSNPTREQILQKGRELANELGFQVNY